MGRDAFRSGGPAHGQVSRKFFMVVVITLFLKSRIVENPGIKVNSRKETETGGFSSLNSSS